MMDQVTLFPSKKRQKGWIGQRSSDFCRISRWGSDWLQKRKLAVKAPELPDQAWTLKPGRGRDVNNIAKSVQNHFYSQKSEILSQNSSFGICGVFLAFSKNLSCQHLHHCGTLIYLELLPFTVHVQQVTITKIAWFGLKLAMQLTLNLISRKHGILWWFLRIGLWYNRQKKINCVGRLTPMINWWSWKFVKLWMKVVF